MKVTIAFLLHLIFLVLYIISIPYQLFILRKNYSGLMDSQRTIKELEEFRRRKAAQQKAATAHTSTLVPDSKIPSDSFKQTISSRPSSHSNSVETAAKVVMQPAVQIRSHSVLGGIWNTCTTWLYQQVMPDHLVKPQHHILPDDTAEENETGVIDIVEDEQDEVESSVDRPPVSLLSKLSSYCRTSYLWCALAGLCGFALAVRYGWGAVFFCLSVLLLISKGLSDSRRKKRGAPSAYSVFNPNCERIEGTTDAEQMQRQMFLPF